MGSAMPHEAEVVMLGCAVLDFTSSTSSKAFISKLSFALEITAVLPVLLVQQQYDKCTLQLQAISKLTRRWNFVCGSKHSKQGRVSPVQLTHLL